MAKRYDCISEEFKPGPQKDEWIRKYEEKTVLVLTGSEACLVVASLERVLNSGSIHPPLIDHTSSLLQQIGEPNPVERLEVITSTSDEEAIPDNVRRLRLVKP